MRKNDRKAIPPLKEKEHTPSVVNIPGDPENCFELLNKYGTYNIQPTADADHKYPAIAQGNPSDTHQTSAEKQ